MGFSSSNNSNQGGGGSSSSAGLDITNVITNNIDVNIDSVVKQLIGGLDKQIDILVSQSNKQDSILLSKVNDTVKLMESSFSILKSTLIKSLDNTVDIIANNNNTLVSKMITPLLTDLKRLQENELAQDKLQQISLEKLLSKLIETQLQQTARVNDTLVETMESLIQSLESIDFVREDNLADWIKQALEPLRIEIIGSIGTPDNWNMENPFDFFKPVKDLLGGFINRLKEIVGVFRKIENGQYSDIEQVKNELFGLGFTGELAEGVFFMTFLVPLFKQIGEALFSKMFTELSFLAIREGQPARPNASDAFDMLMKGIYSEGDYIDNLKDLGFSDVLISKVRQASFNIPAIGDLQELFRRKEITSEQFRNNIISMGFNAYWSQKFEELSFYQAPPQDIIRFMVRDVFNEQLAASGRLFEGGDNPKYLELAEKVGVSKELAMLYWASHWILPSYHQGYEMFQREKMTREDLEQLFVAGDLAPAWRERMLSISYNLPTRVDVRRAYEDDIIQDEKLKEFIRHSGVEPEWRDAIFQWHKARKVKIQSNSSKAKQLTTAQILRTYKNGIQDLNWTIEALKKIGYSQDDALTIINSNMATINDSEDSKYADKFRNEMRNIAVDGYRTRTLSKDVANKMLRDTLLSSELSEQLLTLADTQYRMDRKAELVSITRKLYLGHEIGESQLGDLMRLEGFTQTEINGHLADLRPLRNLRYKELTRADIKKGVAIKELGLEWGIKQLKGLGYSDTTIQEIMLIESWDDTQNSVSL